MCDDSLLQDIFSEGEGGGLLEVGVQRAATRRPERENDEEVEGEEAQEEKRGEGQEGAIF